MSGDIDTPQQQLRNIIERIERLEEDKAAVVADIKEVYGGAKDQGYDTTILRTVIKIRKIPKDERMEQEAILDTYMAALGMLPSYEGEYDDA